MTHEHVVKANDWLIKHKEHVESLVKSEKSFGYPPSEEDKGHPELWKPAHWKWYFINY